MKNRLIAAAAGFLFLALAAPHEAAACSKCAYSGIICGLDQCEDVWVCQEVHFGRGGGSNDCTVVADGCETGGGFCQWAANISPVGKPQVWAPVCHETNS